MQLFFEEQKRFQSTYKLKYQPYAFEYDGKLLSNLTFLGLHYYCELTSVRLE